MSTARDSAVRLGVLFPDLLGTYGDGGNALVLAQRLAWRDIPVEVVTVAAGDATPDSCDLYLVGGGEDGPQVQATRELAEKARADAAERASFDPFFTFFLGGVAVFEDGRRVGAVGVSGLPGDVDEQLAIDAIEATA